MQLRTVLLVDALAQRAVDMRWFLASCGYIVDTVRDAEEALVVFDKVLHDAVVTDLATTRMTGAEMAQMIKQRSPSTPVVVYSREAPADQTCFDSVIEKPERIIFERQLLLLKETLEFLLMGKERASKTSAVE